MSGDLIITAHATKTGRTVLIRDLKARFDGLSGVLAIDTLDRRLILDTGILIAYERGTIDRAALDHDELAIAAVTIAEYRVGIELADTAEHAATRARALAAITSVVDILDYTDTTAAHHARLIAHIRRTGTARGTHDLIIAAHATETGRTILTRDHKARFPGLPGILAIDTL